MTLHEWLIASRKRYTRKVRALHTITRRLPARDVAAFVLCTPRQTYENAVKQWRGWKATGRVTGSLAATRQRYIDALPRDIRRHRRETHAEWERRLRRCKGLGVMKAPFLASLLEPAAKDVPVCLDVWMARGMGITHLERITSKRVEAAQHLAAGMARVYGMPRFAWQWAAWDYIRTRGRDSKQRVMFVNVTDIGRDLR